MKCFSNTRYLSTQAFVTALCAGLACIQDAAAAQEDRDGFYVGLQLGVADPAMVESARTYISHRRVATNCCIHPR